MKIAKIILSLGYVGLTPKVPGTAGSLVTIIFLILLSLFFPLSIFLRVGFLLVIIILGTLLAINLIKKNITGEYDKQWIVIDEFLGMIITASPAFILNLNWDWYFVAFILFRFFDILKPLGLRKIDKINKPWAVVIDDIIAGVYGLIVFIILYSFI